MMCLSFWEVRPYISNGIEHSQFSFFIIHVLFWFIIIKNSITLLNFLQPHSNHWQSYHKHSFSKNLLLSFLHQRTST